MEAEKQPEPINNIRDLVKARMPDAPGSGSKVSSFRGAITSITVGSLLGAGIGIGVVELHHAKPQNHINYDNSAAGVAHAKDACEQAYPTAPVVTSDVLIDHSVDTVVDKQPGNSIWIKAGVVVKHLVICDGAFLNVRGSIDEVDIHGMGAFVSVYNTAHIGKMAIDSNAAYEVNGSNAASGCSILTSWIPVHFSETANANTCAVETNMVDGNPNDDLRLPPLQKFS